MLRLRYYLNRCRLALGPRVAVLPAAWAAYNQGRALIQGLPADTLTARQKLVLLDTYDRTCPPFAAGPVLRDDAVTAYNTGESEWAVREDLTHLWRQGWVELSNTYPQGSLLTAPIALLGAGPRLGGLLRAGDDLPTARPFPKRA